MPLRLAHMADTHLGYIGAGDADRTSATRNLDFRIAYLDTCEQIAQEHQREPIDLVVHAGDLFHHPRPAAADVITGIRGMKILAGAGIPIAIVAGNHDLSRERTTATALHTVAAAMEGEDFAAAIGVRDWFHFVARDGSGIQIDAWSHWSTENLRGQDIAQIPATDDWRICIAHGTVSGSGTLAQDEYTSPLPGRYHYVALGHIHATSEELTAAGPAIMAGPTERCGWADLAAEPGWVLATIDGLVTTEHRTCQHRPFVDLGTFHATIDSIPDLVEQMVEKADRNAREPDGTARRTNCRAMIEGIDRGHHATVRQIVNRQMHDRMFHVKLDFAGSTSLWRDAGKTTALDQPGALNLAALFDEFVDTIEDQAEAWLRQFRAKGHAALDQAAEDMASEEPAE